MSGVRCPLYPQKRTRIAPLKAEPMMKIRRSEITAELFLDKLADKRRREIFEEMVDRILDEGIATLARQRIIAKLFNDAHR